MQLTVTLRTTGRGPLEVLIEAADGAPLAEVADDLTRAVGRPGAELFAGSRQLDPQTPLGHADLCDGRVLGVGAPGPRARPVTGVLELRVVAGPDAGAVRALSQGELTIGRDHTAGLQLADPDLSRRHAAVTVLRDGVRIRDLGSTNGSTVDGKSVGPAGMELPPGALLCLGASTLTVAVPAEPPAAVRSGPDGTRLVNRPPRLVRVLEPPEITLPAEPPERTPSRLPVLAALLPLVAGVGLAVLMHAPQFLLFTLLSPVMLIGNTVSERRGLRRGRRQEQARYQAELAAARTRLAAAVEDDARARRLEAPDLAAIWRAAVGPGQRLWERRRTDTDALLLRLGTADLPARLTVRVGSDVVGADPPVAPAVPVVIGLRDVGVLGLAGPRPPIDALARALVAQLATLHAPADLSLVLLAEDTAAAGWEWIRWLPHLAAAGAARVGLTGDQRVARMAELTRLIDGRSVEGDRLGEPWSGPRTVVLIDGAEALRDLPGMARLLFDGPTVGVHAICVDRSPRRLPAECGATVQVTGEVGSYGQLTRRDGSIVAQIVLDGAGVGWAEELARSLTPLRADADAVAGPPAACRLLSLLGVDRPTPRDVIRSWGRGGRTTRAVVGLSMEGAFAIDLARDGPHALVAGTTGAGKSELLQTIIASLAITNRPNAMTFVLIDYKGGAAFKDCIHLPHTVGMVTDLDGHLTERALASLNAELKRREHLLAAAGAKDIEDYWDTPHHTGDTGAPPDPLPRTILIIDEFASLVEELPDFVTGLIGIAMRGRSLGVHLILATQRPSGVVSPVIRANTNLRIALRVTDDGESRDVIDATDAARIGKTVPGRAFARIGSESPVEFQSARVGGRAPIGAGPASAVRPSPWLELGSGGPAATVAPADAVTDLQQLVSAVRAAADEEHADPPDSPWLPPLPPVVPLADLAVPPGDVLVYGLADHPGEQRRAVAGLDLAHGGSMAVVGGPRSGRSALLRTLLGAAARRYRPDELHCYLLDCAGGALLAAEGLPHCGAVCDQHDVSRGDRTLRRLVDEVGRRQALLARAGLTSVAEQRNYAAAGEQLPWLLLLVDGWEGFSTAYESVDYGRPVDTVLQLVRDGAAAGLRVVVTGDRQLLSGRVGAGFPSKLTLRLSDRGDYLLAGLPPRMVPDPMPDGRGLLAEGPVEVQTALLTSDPSGPSQVAALRDIAAAAEDQAQSIDLSRLPFRVRALPDRVSADSLGSPRAVGPLWTLVGAAGDDAGLAGIDLAVDGPGFLISGPARSGRSTALRTMATSLLARGTPIALLLPRRSPLRALSAAPGVLGVFGPRDDALLADVVAAGPVVVLVDDVHTMTDAPAGEVLTDLLQADDGRRAVIAAGRNDELGVIFRGLAMAVRAARCGLLLQPTSQDGELLGVRLPHQTSLSVPGRGLLVVGGDATPVQVAVGDAPSAGVVQGRPRHAAGEIGRKALDLVRCQ